jgi:hypothetical protein
MAEVYLAMVDHTPHDDLRTHYRKLAKVYNALADNEDRIASNLKLANWSTSFGPALQEYRQRADRSHVLSVERWLLRPVNLNRRLSFRVWSRSKLGPRCHIQSSG